MSETDAVGALYAEIEKAGGKGLIPRGGSSKLARRIWRRPKEGGNSARGDRAVRYLGDRHKGGWMSAKRKTLRMGSASVERRGGERTGVYKSLEALDAEIEKARGRGLMPKGGTSRMHGKVLGALLRRNPTQALSRKPKLRGKLNRALMRAESYLGDRMSDVRRKGGKNYTRHGIYKGADAIRKAKPKTLYVYRPVENAEDIIAWAESQGFTSTQPGEKLHVTLAYSKTPLNWAMLHDDYHLEPSEYARSCGDCGPVLRSDDNSKRRKISGGVREVKALGKDGAIVLAFESDSLTNRWMDFKRAGAIWKFPSFTPHITITYSGNGVDLDKVHPYAGDIILGEECWEEVSENGQAEAIAAEKVTKAGFAAIDARLAALEAKPAAEAA